VLSRLVAALALVVPALVAPGCSSAPEPEPTREEPLATDVDRAVRLVVNGEHLYWIANGFKRYGKTFVLESCKTAACSATRRVVLGSDLVTWSPAAFADDHLILSRTRLAPDAVEGCVRPEPAACADTAERSTIGDTEHGTGFVRAAGNLGRVATARQDDPASTATHVAYWTESYKNPDGSVIGSLERAEFTVSPSGDLSASPGGRGLVYGVNGFIRGLALDDENLYWSESTAPAADIAVIKSPRALAAKRRWIRTELAKTARPPTDAVQRVWVHSGHAYWLSGEGPTRLVSCSVAGCPSGVRTLAQGSIKLAAIDASGAYFIEPSSSSSGGWRLMTCSLPDCGGGPRQLSPLRGDQPESLALDEKAVYVSKWFEIVRVPK
jgi:hypothetical protein